MKVKIYCKDTIHSLEWPQTENGIFSREYLEPIVKNGTNYYFSNISTDLRIIKIDDIIIPITVNDHVEPNAYVCSTYTHYVRYAAEEIKHLKSSIVKNLANRGTQMLGSFLKKRNIDKTIFVNNWLFPTNLYPNLSREHIEAITKTLIERFPNHTIAFRSISNFSSGRIAKSLKQLKYEFLLCRNIYYTDTQSPYAFKARMTKSDHKLLSTSDCSIIENKQIPSHLSFRLAELYQMLNIDKYSECNPQYKPEFMELLKTSSNFKLKAWIKDNQAHAVLGYYTANGIMNSPLFGYDTLFPQQAGLYRQISAMLLNDARKKKHLLHQSSGAGHFKQLRRAKKDFEYTAVYTKHLPLNRRIPWKVLYFGMNTIGKKILTKASHTF